MNKIEQEEDAKQQDLMPELFQNEEQVQNMAINESSHSLLEDPLNVVDISNLEQANLAFKKKRDIEDVFDQFNVSYTFVNLSKILNLKN